MKWIFIVNDNNNIDQLFIYLLRWLSIFRCLAFVCVGTVVMWCIFLKSHWTKSGNCTLFVKLNSSLYFALRQSIISHVRMYNYIDLDKGAPVLLKSFVRNVEIKSKFVDFFLIWITVVQIRSIKLTSIARPSTNF